jgi:hypothetical protein
MFLLKLFGRKVSSRCTKVNVRHGMLHHSKDSFCFRDGQPPSWNSWGQLLAVCLIRVL